MKKFKILSLILALLFIMPLCLTACNKDDKKEGPISSTEQLLDRVEEFVDYSLLVGGYVEGEPLYDNMKQNTLTYIDTQINKLPQGTLDNFVNEVLKVSGVKNSELSSAIKASTNFVESLIKVGEKAKELHQRYTVLGYNENLLNILEGLESFFGGPEIMTEVVEPQRLLQNGGDLYASFINNSFISQIVETMFYSMLELEKAGFALLEEDYNAFMSLYKALYNSVIANSQKNNCLINYYAKSMISLSVAPNSQEFIKGNLQGQQKVDFENTMATLKTNYGVENKEVFNAYFNFITIVQKYTLDLEYAMILGVSFDQIKTLASTSAVAMEGKNVVLEEDFPLLVATDANLRKATFSIAKSFGQAIMDNFMGDKERNSLLESANILNRNGLGFFVEKYVDLYRYGVNFIGHCLINITEQDFLSLRETTLGEVGNGEKAVALRNKLSADIVLRLYNSYKPKNNLKNSFNDNEKFDNVILNLTAISNTLTKADITDEYGELSYSNITQDHIDSINTSLSNIENVISIWLMANKDHLSNGLAEIEAYIAPLMPAGA